MKKILVLVITLITMLSANAQIVEKENKTVKIDIGKNRFMGQYHSELYAEVEDKDTSYIIMFRNAKYETLTDIQILHFAEVGGTLNSLYNILKSFFKDENKKNKEYKREFKLGNDNVICSNERMMGANSIFFWTDKGYFYLTEKQVDKLFGK